MSRNLGDRIATEKQVLCLPSPFINRGIEERSMEICKVDWCTSEVTKTGLCNRHYLQMRRHGKILPIKRNCSDSQEFIFVGAICQIPLYDKKGILVGTAVIDAEDYPLVKDYKFNYQGLRYVRGNSSEFTLLHQLILGTRWVDHKDGDTLNNTRYNLRECTNQQNQFNQKPQIGRTSKYKGVTKRERKNGPDVFNARIQFDLEHIRLGTFKKEKDAAQAYNNAAVKYFGEFARLNKI